MREILEPLLHFVGSSRWALGGSHILVALLAPVVLVSLFDRLIRRR